MVFTALQCEICESMLKFPVISAMRDRKMPEGWYTLYQGDFQSNDPWHFCSETCLNTWTTTRAISKDMKVKEQE